MSSQTERPKSDRVTVACRNCRYRKVKCSGGHPCRDCSRLRKECIYPPPQRRRKLKEDYVTNVIEDRLARVEAQLQNPGEDEARDRNQSLSSGVENTAWQPATLPNITVEARLDRRPTAIRSAQGLTPGRLSTNSPEPESQDSVSRQHSLSELQTLHNTTEQTRAVTLNCFSDSIDHPPTVYEPQVSNPEHQEPLTWMSVCSDAGSQWVCETTGTRDFGNIVRRFTNSMNRYSSSNKNVSEDLKSFEPDETTTWEYVNAFFENCWEARVGIIHRPDYEARLQAHFHGGLSAKDDAAWTALRNVVFAGGYRRILAQDPAISFATAQARAWQVFFKKALSVLTELLLPPSNIMAIQALALMAYYTDGLGNPTFQDILCSNAVHIALSKSLHRQLNKSSEESSDDTLKTMFLWWAVYSLEKNLCLSSGRPSMIDDDTVGLQIPNAIPRGSDVDLDCLILTIRHAQISSQITREIMSVKATELPTEQLERTVNRLHNQLKSLLEELPSNLKIGTLARPSPKAHLVPRLIHILYLHFSIYGSFMALHSLFFYPWVSSRFLRQDLNTTLESQIAFSSSTVAEAARKILLAVRMLTTNVTTPRWLALSYPIYAHLNLFVYILRYPTLPTTSADLGLLDVCAGHFGYIDFITSSEISISLPRESVNLAARIVKAARSKENKAETPVIAQISNTCSPSSRIRTLDNNNLNFNHSRSDSEALSDIRAFENNNLDFTHSQPDCEAFSDIGNFANIDAGAWNLLSSFNVLGSNTPGFQTLNE